MYDCEFIDNNGYQGGAIVAGGGLVMRCLFQRNLAAHEGGAILGKPTVIDSRFIENEIIWNGGAGIWGGGTVINCEFTRNRTPYFADWGGAAVVNARPIGGKNLTGPGTYINCVFNGNQTVGRGGAAYVDLMQTGTFINCTFTANSALGANGALHAHANSQAVVRNCIMWNNSPDEIGGPGQISVQYSSVQGGWPGQGNIAMNPLFVDPLGPDGIPGTGDEDLRLAPGSPCIDSGNNLALPPDTYDLNGNGNVTEPLPIDKDGNLRRINDPATPNTGHPPGASVIVDMGAYEFNDFRPLLGDVTGDGVVNVNDLLGVINSWGPCPAFPQHCPADLDQNGVVNHHDLLIVIQNWG
jgi:predicted outer membrane repeat protein